MKTSIALKTLLGAASLALPLVAFAESNVQTGAATAAPGATAHVNFSIVIPKILYLRVGTGSSYTTGALSSNPAVDLITFSPTAAQVGNGTAVAGTGGDLTGGVETAAVVSNSGNVTLNATATGALSDGTGDTIPVLSDHHDRDDADLRHGAARAGADATRPVRMSCSPRRPPRSSWKMRSGRSRMPTPRRCRPVPTVA